MAAVVLRRARLLARWARAAGEHEVARAMEPRRFMHRSDVEVGAKSWLDRLQGPYQLEPRSRGDLHEAIHERPASGKDFAHFHRACAVLERVTRAFGINHAQATLLIKRFQFMHRVDPVTGCWNWTASSTGERYRYPQIHVPRSRSMVHAHRLSFVIHHGEVPNGKEVIRSCENDRCVSPHHVAAAPRGAKWARGQAARWDVALPIRIDPSLIQRLQSTLGITGSCASLLIRRFLTRCRIDPLTGCWKWTARCFSLMVPGTPRKLTANQLSYLMHKGAIPKGTEVTCDYDPLCVCPRHLTATRRYAKWMRAQHARWHKQSIDGPPTGANNGRRRLATTPGSSSDHETAANKGRGMGLLLHVRGKVARVHKAGNG